MGAGHSSRTVPVKHPVHGTVGKRGLLNPISTRVRLVARVMHMVVIVAPVVVHVRFMRMHMRVLVLVIMSVVRVVMSVSGMPVMVVRVVVHAIIMVISPERRMVVSVHPGDWLMKR